MRKTLIFLLSLSLMLAFTACAGKDKSTAGENTGDSEIQSQAPLTSENPSANADTRLGEASTQLSSTQSSTSIGIPSKNEELLQSASVDLDSDGINEQVEVLQAEIGDPAQSGTVDLEGILRIGSKNGSKDIVFIKKPEGLTGIMSSIEFSDLDGDGSKDVFIIIPESGASFALNYYFAYNYKNGNSFKFNTDAALADFAGGFQFLYKGKGILSMKNESYGFTADFDITSVSNGIGPDSENNQEYERAWVDANPVEISGDSKIGLRPGVDGRTEVRVPLPVFGLAAADMIGEVDMYFSFDAGFTPVLKSFEVLDFNDDMSFKKIGEWKNN